MQVPAGSKGCSALALAFQEGEIPMQMTVVTCRQGAYTYGTCTALLGIVCMNFVSLKWWYLISKEASFQACVT